MRYHCHIPEDIWPKIDPYIDCDSWANPMEEEYWFDNPTDRFRFILALLSIETYTDG